MQLELGRNHLRYLVLLLWYTNASPYKHCTLIKLLWARVAEYDLNVDALLENDLTDIRSCYHSNIYQRVKACTIESELAL